MIIEEYVSFETAKLLNEKGFDGRVTYGRAVQFIPEFFQLRPTQSIAMKWLRETHNLYIQVMLDSWALGSHSGYYVVIQRIDNDFEMMLQDALDDVFYKTYEESCEAAIKYCLENLI